MCLQLMLPRVEPGEMQQAALPVASGGAHTRARHSGAAGHSLSLSVPALPPDGSRQPRGVSAGQTSQRVKGLGLSYGATALALAALSV
jgi:hypothetical protein